MRVTSAPLAALVGLTLAVTLGAQARYDTFGRRCAGTGKVCGPVVTGLNTGGGTFADAAGVAARTYALAAKASGKTDVCGFEILAHTRSNDPCVVETFLCADDNGAPGSVLATGTMLIGEQPTAKWYRTTFATPATIADGAVYWIAFKNLPTTISLPIVTQGATAGHAYRDPSSSSWTISNDPLAWTFGVYRLADVASPACNGTMAAPNVELPLQDTTLPVDTDYAFPFEATGRGGKICALWMNANSRGAPYNVIVRSYLWLDAGGKPGALMRTGQFEMDPRTQLYRSAWASYPIVRGQRIWLGWSNPSPSINPNLSVGGTLESYAFKPTSGSTWQLSDTGLPWNYMLRMTDETGSEAPILSPVGIPKLGTRFDVRLDFAPANAISMLWNGSSRTQWLWLPLPFEIPTSYGCSQHIAFDGFVLIAVADSRGGASVPLFVPNDQILNGLQLQQQWLVLDSLANPLGMTWSNGGTAFVGN